MGDSIAAKEIEQVVCLVIMPWNRHPLIIQRYFDLPLATTTIGNLQAKLGRVCMEASKGYQEGSSLPVSFPTHVCQYRGGSFSL
jgi:hypothetical protein